ncbi:MAG: fructose-1,6-bisphosphatase [Ruminococcaceae bacterium]|nr:fructose-1,6-bisphosphatase [Oscillospiraceae bacterium]
MDVSSHNIEYLELLSKDYPNIASVSTEIINLCAILNLPKGTEHFVSDLHGEHEAFLHVLKNASGVIKNKIDMLYSTTVTEQERKLLATLVYYPEQKLYYLKQHATLTSEWFTLTLYRLVELCRMTASKYTRSKVRKAMPKDFSYILDELLHTAENEENKHEYYSQIIKSIIDIGRAEEFIVALCNLIRRLSIDHLHVLGDVFDRGPRADLIMDELIACHSIDFQWGNHDIEWIGAASGHTACIANVIRNSLRYNNFDVVEIGYGINTRPLANFALDVYADDPCENFVPLDSRKKAMHSADAHLTAKMHKAISVIQFKLEGKIISEHPEYGMESRKLLDKIDIARKTVVIDGKSYPLTDTSFPTVDFSNPYVLTAEEEFVVSSLRRSFLHSEKLRHHIQFMINRGGMYKIYNGNLLFHGCIPLDSSGKLDTVNVFGTDLKGKSYLDAADKAVRQFFISKSTSPESDFLWYLWCGNKSPLFGKDTYTTFESYFTAEPELLKEEKNHYYSHINSESVCDMILEEFGLSSDSSHIINGHVPVKTGKGESPVKANGKLYVIDGGFSKPYQKTTGIAGYTLINNSYGFSITSHHPFTTINDVIENDFDLHSSKKIVEYNVERKRVADTDNGVRIKHKIKILSELLDGYKKGYIREWGR